MPFFTTLYARQILPAVVWLLCLLSFSANAQSGLPDPATRFRASTLVKLRPLALVRSSVNVAVEQTVRPRSSIGLEAYHTVTLLRSFAPLGRGMGGGLTYRYYPLRQQTAPNGFYTGARLSYDHVSNNLLLTLLLPLFGLSQPITNASLWAAGPMVGYQYCGRSGLLLDGQGSIGLLANATYVQRDANGLSSERQTTVAGPVLARVYVGVGYRFGSRR